MRTMTRRWKTVSTMAALAALFTATGCRKAKTNPFPASGAVSGWQKTGDTRTYAAKDLWQYIDGEAEKYVSAGVVSASTAEYKYKDSLEAVVDVYDMGSAAGALKVFDGDSSGDGAHVNLGDAGVEYAQSVSFRKGAHLVHVVAYESTPATQQALMALARGIEAKL